MAEECEYCDEEFSSERERLEHEMDEHGENMTSHERDDKKSQLNKIQEKERVAGLKKKRKLRDGAIAAVLLVGLAAGGFFAYQNAGSIGGVQESNATIGVGEPIHWHAPYTIEVCGERRILEGGPKLAHTHGQSKFHLEGVRQNREQATLDWIIDSLGGEFSNTGILGYEEPESCPGTDEPGNLTVVVNGQQLDNPEDYIVKDGDNIVIRYQ